MKVKNNNYKTTWQYWITLSFEDREISNLLSKIPSQFFPPIYLLSNCPQALQHNTFKPKSTPPCPSPTHPSCSFISGPFWLKVCPTIHLWVKPFPQHPVKSLKPVNSCHQSCPLYCCFNSGPHHDSLLTCNGEVTFHKSPFMLCRPLSFPHPWDSNFSLHCISIETTVSFCSTI